jgi:hypothetical protein
VDAKLTPGEFVIPARAAAALGADTLEQLRRGWLPLTSQGPRGYQEGGQVLGVQRPYPNLSGDTDFLPALGNALSRLAAATVGRIMVTSGYRSVAEQAVLAARNPNRMMVAAPGKSRHQQGTAADISPQRPSYGGKERGFGLHFPMSWEPWHIELSGGASAAGAAGAVLDAPLSLPDVPKVDVGGDWYGGTAKAFMEFVRKLAQEWVDQNTIVISPDVPGGGAPAPPGQVREWIVTALKHGGWPMTWLNGLYSRAMQESGGNPRAINLWDSNAKAGIPSKGLFQTIDPTFQSYRDPSLPNDVYHPIANAVAAIRYMLARYGSIVPANGRGYADGGIVPATAGGRRILAGEGGRDEAVIPLPRGWQRMFAALAESAGAQETPRTGPAVNIEHYEVKENADHRRVFAMAEFEQRAGRI